MKGIKLFSSPGCHLCELGEEILFRVQTTYKFEIEIVDISSSEELVEKYGIMIPVPVSYTHLTLPTTPYV